MKTSILGVEQDDWMASAETLLSRETSRAGKGLRAVWSGGIGSGLVGNQGIGSIIQHRCWKRLRLLIGGHYSPLGRGRLLRLTITRWGKEKHKRRARTSKEVLLWDNGGWTKAWSGSKELRIFAGECARNGLLVAETLASSKQRPLSMIIFRWCKTCLQERAKNKGDTT